MLRFPIVGVVMLVIALWVMDDIDDEAIRACRVEERGLAPRAEVGGYGSIYGAEKEGVGPFVGAKEAVTNELGVGCL